MQLRVFADGSGSLYLEISSPSLIYERRLFVPMLPSSTALLNAIAPETVIAAGYRGDVYKIPFLLVHSEDTRFKNWTAVGNIEESDSRNVLNHILDILAWD